MSETTTETFDEFGAVLLAFDVEGFSRTVEKATIRHGRRAGELAAQQILAGEHIATDLARRAGFDFADALGDGAVYLRKQGIPTAAEARGLQRVEEELRYEHQRRTGLSVRTAWTHGSVRLTRPKARLLEHVDVLWGPAVARLHDSLARRPGGWRRLASAPQLPPPDLAHRDGEIADRVFVFIRLCRGGRWAQLDEDTLNAALFLIERWADRLGGALERITHDEKGMHARVGLPAAVTNDVVWPRALIDAQTGLRGLGLDGAVAAARGAVYRGPSEHGSTIVHGGAVNRAAKLCAVQEPGGLALDPSLSGATPRPPRPSTDAGNAWTSQQEQARQWLAGEPSRLVNLVGETGSGKSHLLRQMIARGHTPFDAVIAGTPSRILDPMGAGFEILGQCVRAVRSGEDDHGWAEAVLAEAGVDPSAAAFCTRALRGVEAARDADLKTGPERAALIREGLLALFAALARERVLMIAVDDLHELDDASLALIGGLLDRRLPARILATSRLQATQSPVAALRAHLSCLEIALPPLTAAEVAALVWSIAGDRIDPAEVLALSGGAPYQAVQTTFALLEDDQGDRARDLSVVLERRLDSLDGEAIAVLRAIAIGDRAWTISDLAAIVPEEIGLPSVETAVGRLSRARLVDPVSGTVDHGYRAAHPLLRELINRKMPGGVEKTTALRAARRLTLIQRTLGGVTLPELAALWSSAGSRGRAALLYERAARAAADDGADSACAQLLDLAIALFADAPEDTKPRRLIEWRAELSRAEWSMGLAAKANATAKSAIVLARRRPLTNRLRENAAQASAMRAETGHFIGDLKEILIGSLEVGRFAPSSPDRAAAQGRGISALGYGFGLLRLTSVADRILSGGERLATGRDPRPAAFALTARAILHFIFCRWVEGDDALARARAICEAWPQHHLAEVIETTCGLGAHLRGDGDTALAHFATLAALADRRGSTLHSGWSDYASAQTLLALDRPHEGWTKLLQAEDKLQGLGDAQSNHICEGLRARLAFALGEIDEALSSAARCGLTSRSLAPTNYSSTEPYSAPALVGVLVAATSDSRARRREGLSLARRHLPDLVSYARVFPIAKPRARLIQAMLNHGSDPAKAAARVGESEAAARGLGLGFEAALARRAGEMIRNRGPI